MKSDHIKQIYNAKYQIVRNNSRIIDLIRKQDEEGAKTLREENESLRSKVQKQFGIILD